jgi:hypothetical protein
MRVTQPKQVGTILKENFSKIDQQKSLSPENPAINESLSKIVNALIKAEDCQWKSSQCSIHNSVKSKLPEKCMVAEIELEKYWSKRIASEKDLEKFPYIKNYRDIVRQEIRLLSNPGGKKNNFDRLIFLGSGPLPLTAIEMSKHIDQKIICVEMNTDFVDISKSLIQRLSLCDQIEIRHNRAEKIDFLMNDIPIVAIHLDRHDLLIDKLSSSGIEFFIQRDVSELMECLYHPPVRKYRGFKKIKTMRLPGLVNSSVLYGRQL